MNHFLLTYVLAPDYLERRPDHRAEHLALARSAAEHGQVGEYAATQVPA